MTKNAIIDVSINSTGFCVASQNAEQFLSMRRVRDALLALNAATFLFQLAGLGGIAACGAVLTHLMCDHWEAFADPASPDYVENKPFMDALAAGLCTIVAWPFIQMIGHVASTILFCMAVDEHRMPPPPPQQNWTEDFTPGCCDCGTSRNRDRYLDSPANRDRYLDSRPPAPRGNCSPF
jgi:hypothetical protein